MNIAKIRKKVAEASRGRVNAELKNNCIVLSGCVDSWDEAVEACSAAATPYSKIHVVNDVTVKNFIEKPMRMPALSDTALDGEKPDVLIIGGGISGASIARELSKWKLSILLVEKEPDFAMQASGRNDGEVHPGIDLSKGSLKHYYIRKGNKMYGDVCKELGVEFRRVGQYVCFNEAWAKPVIALYVWKRKHIDKIEDSEIISGKELHRREPSFNGSFKFAISNPSTGCVCPYGLTIAYAENAVMNGAEVMLNTAVTDMQVENGRIVSVATNRGTVFPRIVINAAGVFSEEIAKMANDRFFSIHPRRGTNSILDKKAGRYMHSVASIKELASSGGHTKGGGILHTVHDNLLIGPDAVETSEKENVATNPESIEKVFTRQKKTMPALSERDIITYFTGVRAPTFEEDFIIEKGRNCQNIIHCAGIQSPGLTTAPAVALDVEKMAVEMLGAAEKNTEFNPVRKPIPALRDMSDEERAKIIAENPDYGEIVCRCEEISKGEILDALNSPVCVPTLDGVKKRVRPGMGRCQGGFCSPLVTKIIAEFLGKPVEEVRKNYDGSVITYGTNKGGTAGE
ncbi:MAG: NAD(P)/FAD-dependent oxidoreductase [Clostridia bacterium]|nr:NAD(P)/FAD-dependent oxidoreductase [Clostridia bacterium]